MLRNMNTLRVLAVCGIIGPVLFTGLVVIISYLRPGYSHMSQAISELGEVGAPNAIVQDTNFILVGLLIIAFSFGLHRGISEGRGSKVGPALVIIFGAVAVYGIILDLSSTLSYRWIANFGASLEEPVCWLQGVTLLP